LLFELKYGEPFVEEVRVRPLELYYQRPLNEEQPGESVETRERGNEEGSAILFEERTEVDVRRLYCAAAKLVDEVVLQRSRKFTYEEAQLLGATVLSCIDQVCKDLTSDIMSREEMQILIPRIFDVLVKNVEKMESEEHRLDKKRVQKEDEIGFCAFDTFEVAMLLFSAMVVFLLCIYRKA
jgi:hypothetical protein